MKPDTDTTNETIKTLQDRLAKEMHRRMDTEKSLEKTRQALNLSERVLQKVTQSLDEQRQQLDITLDNVMVGVFLVNRHGQIVRTNRTAIEMFAFADDNILEARLPDLFVDPLPCDLAQIEDCVRGNQNQLMNEANVRRADGQEFPAEYAVNIVTSLDGRPQTVWIFRDIVKRKQRESERVALEQELAKAQKFEALGTLASGIAHEINTPMQYVSDNLSFLQRSISTLIELASQNSSKDKQDNKDIDFLIKEMPIAVEQALKGIGNVDRIVRAINEYSYPGDTSFVDVDLGAVVKDAVSMSRHQWKNAAEMIIELPKEPVIVQAVPGQLNQVLLNMLTNAAQAIEARPPEAEGEETKDAGNITVSVNKGKHDIQITVSDNGCGIPVANKDRIFDPFFTTKGVGVGSGQGLAISQRIIRDGHGGNICLNSKEGKGSRFTISLPVLPAASLPAKPRQQSIQGSAA